MGVFCIWGDNFKKEITPEHSTDEQGGKLTSSLLRRAPKKWTFDVS